MKHFNPKNLLCVIVLLAGNLLSAAEIQPATAPEVVSGTLSSIDMQNHVIIVGGTQIQLPALGHIDKKLGQRVSVAVRRDSNGRKLFTGFIAESMGGSLGQ